MAEHTFVVLAYKQSPFLEDCIKSVLGQSVKSRVIIATSTPNGYISGIAEKYGLDIKVNTGKTGIGYDFDFAVKCGETDLVTVAHQDDVYDSDYSKEIINAYSHCPDSLIIFPDYYEIRKQGKVYSNTNLKIKKVLLFPLRFRMISDRKFIKRSALRFGDAICCPAVAFNKRLMPDEIFACDMKCNIDWYAWERLSKLKGYFIYIKKPLMGHRIYGESTTSEVLRDNGRTSEDLFMFKKFWPAPIARMLQKLYSNSEKSNEE